MSARENNFSGSAVLVLIADAAYVEYAKQVFASAKTSGAWEEDCLLLTTCSDSQLLQAFTTQGIQVLNVREKSTEYGWPATIADQTWTTHFLKYYLFTEYFKQWDSIVYVDIDTVIVGNICPVRSRGKFMACHDGDHLLGDQFTDREMLVSSGYSPLADAFNTGVFSFGTQLITSQTLPALIKLTEQFYAHSKYKEQPILNLFFYRKWKALPQTYNYFPDAWYRSERLINFASVLHFPGSLDPWQPGNPYNNQWTRNLDDFEKYEHLVARESLSPGVIAGAVNWLADKFSRINYLRIRKKLLTRIVAWVRPFRRARA